MCADTHQACFCCEACASAAESTPGSLSTAMRRTLAQVPWDALSADERHHVRLCLQAASVKAAAAQGQAEAQARLQAIEDLAAPCTQANESTAESLQRVHSALAAACGGAAPLHEVEVQKLINIDAANGYGIMAPTEPDVRFSATADCGAAALCCSVQRCCSLESTTIITHRSHRLFVLVLGRVRHVRSATRKVMPF